MQQTPRIFVSHSHTDDVWCRGFVDTLQSLGYDVWYDAQSLRGGQQWRSEIEKELAARDIFIVIITPAALASQWVQKEIALADAEHKQVVPVIQQNCDPKGFLKLIQFINVVGKDVRAAAAIVAAQMPLISPILPAPQAPSVFPQIQAFPAYQLNPPTPYIQPSFPPYTARTIAPPQPKRPHWLVAVNALIVLAATFMPWYTVTADATQYSSGLSISVNAWSFWAGTCVGITNILAIIYFLALSFLSFKLNIQPKLTAVLAGLLSELFISLYYFIASSTSTYSVAGIHAGFDYGIFIAFGGSLLICIAGLLSQ